MSTESKPFHCPKCADLPKEAFTINATTDDWIMVYPEEHLVHFHMGPSTDTIEENESLGDFALKWWDALVAQYPDKKFFIIVDLSRKDDSEVIEGNTREALNHIRNHPQDAANAAYGFTASMAFLLNVMAKFTRRPVNLRENYEQCVEDYEKWFSDKSNITL